MNSQKEVNYMKYLVKVDCTVLFFRTHISQKIIIRHVYFTFLCNLVKTLIFTNEKL